jgi:hypothetical protein
LAPSLARADPVLQVSVDGDCPGRSAVVRELEARRLSVGASSIELSVDRTAGTARLRLEDRVRQRVLERQIDSDDCAAAAAAFALIAEAYFVEVGALRKARDTQAPMASSRSIPAAPPRVRSEELQARSGSRVASGRQRGPYWHVLAGAGVEAAPLESLLAPAFYGAAGVHGVASGAFSRLRLVTTTRTLQATTSDRVWRWPVRAELEGGLRIGRSIEAWLGAGLSMVLVRSLDQTGATTTRWSPVLAAGMAWEKNVGDSWALRLDVTGFVLAVQERYLVASQEIGRGPRLGCGLWLGVDWGRR